MRKGRAMLFGKVEVFELACFKFSWRIMLFHGAKSTRSDQGIETAWSYNSRGSAKAAASRWMKLLNLEAKG